MIWCSNDNAYVVARFAKEIRAETVLCLTATATPAVASDICAGFDIPSEAVFRTPSYRSNLRLLAQSFESNAEKEPELVEFFRTHQGPSIVYVQTHEVCFFLHCGDYADLLSKQK